jgi:hypothetical protein
MTAKPRKLSNTARALLAVASTRDDHLILAPWLPIAGCGAIAGKAAGLAWRVGDSGVALVLRATAVGLLPETKPVSGGHPKHDAGNHRCAER